MARGMRLPRSYLWFAARPETRRCPGAFVRFGKEPRDRNSQNLSEGIETRKSDVLRATFDPADIGAVDTSFERETFLRQPLGNAKSTQIPAEDLSSVHAPAQSQIEALTIDGLIIPYLVLPRSVAVAGAGSSFTKITQTIEGRKGLFPMRIAVMIISLCMMLVVAMQSCAVFVGGGLAKDEGLSQGGASGIGLAFLFVLGAAFVLNLPRVSMVIFLIGSFIGVAGASAGGFKDMWVWATLSLILAVMSYFGSRELRRKAAAASNAGK